jgi:hypothetical protein
VDFAGASAVTSTRALAPAKAQPVFVDAGYFFGGNGLPRLGALFWLYGS